MISFEWNIFTNSMPLTFFCTTTPLLAPTLYPKKMVIAERKFYCTVANDGVVVRVFKKESSTVEPVFYITPRDRVSPHLNDRFMSK